ncbi:hypothetical protein J7E73_00320 [Paenibacillus albidus]|uniref:hypothetical protein n=1 Tax=Paenibacillus albidus TaxID=2041023 RepID=UPI001BE7497B|nr:hypothetical protein [Paenibacillus albidus]MBT2287600.1 hypothetical protein [Paenibacillus albidus]
MPYESGGRGDKTGNRYEFRWAVYQTLQVLDEKIDYFILEALGDDEQGIDIWIGNKNGSREGQQCKGRSGSKEYWEFGTANAKGIFTNWKFHLDRDVTNTVSLVSPLAFTLLEDILNRAKSTSDLPNDFYHNQILNASKEVKEFFKNFCKVMGINLEKETDLIKCISYLKRILYRQFPDTQLKEIIISKISLLFIGNEEEIYDTLVSWIVEGNTFGKQISLSVLYKLFKERGIKLKELANDARLVPRIEELNREFSASFIPFKAELISREEFERCRKQIDFGNSLLIHGKAGRGKSGCTEDIINYCLENTIPYLAIKLDKRIPSGNAEKWGENLGLPASIAHCIHSVSKTEKAVIILDQLDALRWTQAHSRDALLVCEQIINQVEKLNLERRNKISVVFVCRTYDLENDNNIKSLFNTSEKKSEVIQWNKIQINDLNDETVQDVIGTGYSSLTSKLKEILRIPSNIYIWSKLDKGNTYNECSTANQLVTEWWKQLTRKCFELGFNETDINGTKEKLISNFDKLGRICIPIKIMSINTSCLDFLSSNGFLVMQGNKISFAHQSILDCFLVEKMLTNYYETEDILDVIGSKDKQTPGRRYQVQMLLQNLIEFDSEDFLEAGQKIIASDQIRYSVKFVFFEILNQLDVIDGNIQGYIIENCENELYSEHIINNVVYSRPQYIRLLRNYGLLDKWFSDPEKKNIALNLLISLSPNYEAKDVEFIMKHAFQSQEDDNRFSRCFSHDINHDTDEMFEMRMEFYNKYPQMADTYLDIKAMLENCEMRTIRVFAFLLENKLKRQSQSIYKYAEEFLEEDSEIFIKNGIDVIKILLPHIPTSNDEMKSYSEWSGRSAYRRSLERASVEIIKKANSALIALDPNVFLRLYKEYMGKGIVIFNEILLDALYNLPHLYSDYIIEYLCSNFENNIFDKTSGNGDELLLAKRVLTKHSEYCKQDVFNMLENKVIGYISKRAKDIYQRRIQYNQENKGYRVYWSFWGDLQKEILEILPYNRLSNKAKDLICILRRRFIDESSLYKYSNGHGGWVSSSIAGKTLNNKTWIGILTNKKLNDKRSHRWKEVSGGFLENSIESFSDSLSDATSAEPERMIKLMLSHNAIVLDVYIDSLFSGVAHSKNLSSVPLNLLEEMILKYLYNLNSYRASSICTIIESREEVTWSQEILNILKDIAVNHENPELGKPNVTNNEDNDMRTFDMLQSNALNCVRGKAARSIAHLIWKDYSFFEEFKDTLELIVVDQNPAVRLASFFALWPSYNIDKDWASERIINLYKQDYRLAGFHGSKDMFFLLYSQYRQSVLEIIKQCYDSEDKELIEMGAHCLAEMYILKNEFEDDMTDVDIMSKLQAENILNMVMIYFNKDNYNSLAKDIIRRFKTSNLDLEMPISRLFYDNLINLTRDKDFLIEIISSNLTHRSLHAFAHYLEEESKSVIDYKDIILSMSRHLMNNQADSLEGLWGVQDEISKLIIGLYDETSGSTKSEMKIIAQECLDIWDMMFEKQIGPVRKLSREMMER